MAALSQTPSSAAPPQSLASRGRRPALIPYNADLSISLSAASTALGMASYSPNKDKQCSGGVLWIVPGSSAPPLPLSPQWDEPTEERSRKPAPSWDQEMDVDEKEERDSVRELIAKDLFSWVNSDSDNEQPHQQKQKVSYLSKPSPNTGPDTAPTSPLSGNFPEQLEFRRRRLEEAARAESK